MEVCEQDARVPLCLQGLAETGAEVCGQDIEVCAELLRKPGCGGCMKVSARSSCKLLRFQLDGWL